MTTAQHTVVVACLLLHPQRFYNYPVKRVWMSQWEVEHCGGTLGGLDVAWVERWRLTIRMHGRGMADCLCTGVVALTFYSSTSRHVAELRKTQDCVNGLEQREKVCLQ